MVRSCQVVSTTCSLLIIVFLSCIPHGWPLCRRWCHRIRQDKINPLLGGWRRVCLSNPTSRHFSPVSRNSVGGLYLWSAESIRKGTANGLESALGRSHKVVPRNLMLIACSGQLRQLFCSFHLFRESRRVPFQPFWRQPRRYLDCTTGRLSTTTDHRTIVHNFQLCTQSC